MKTPALLCVAALAIAVLPSADGDHRALAEVAQTTIDSGWHYDGRWRDECYDQPMVVSVEAVNQRLLITVEVPWSNVVVGPVLGQIGSNCELVFQTEPGHFRDPCTGVNGNVMPMPVISPADPYFYFDGPSGAWIHRVGTAEYRFDSVDSPRYEAKFSGTCRLNGVYGFWQGYWETSVRIESPA